MGESHRAQAGQGEGMPQVRRPAPQQLEGVSAVCWQSAQLPPPTQHTTGRQGTPALHCRYKGRYGACHRWQALGSACAIYMR